MGLRAQEDDRVAVVPINRTRSGVDARSVFHEALPAGRLAESLWCENDHRLLVSETILPGAVAGIAYHVLDKHEPLHIDDSLELRVCEVASCGWAQAWTALTRSDALAATGV